jgi:hypothetical protein
VIAANTPIRPFGMTVQRRERALTPPPLPGIAREPLPNQPAAELVKVLLLRSRLPILHLTRVKADLSDGPPEGQRGARAGRREREKLAGQLGELEAAERVLARYSKGVRARKMASASTPIAATKAAAPARSGGRPRTTAAKPAGDRRSSPNLSDQFLALASGKTQQEM